MVGSKKRVASLRSPPLLIAVVNRKNLPTDHDEVTIYLTPRKINPLLEKSWLKMGASVLGMPASCESCRRPGVGRVRQTGAGENGYNYFLWS